MTDLVKAFVGDLEVIGNGTVHVTPEQNFKIVIGQELEVHFQFQKDDKNKALNTNFQIVDGALVGTLTNYINPLGEGFLSPMYIGTFKDRKLSISFFVHTPSVQDFKRIISYVVYLGGNE